MILIKIDPKSVRRNPKYNPGGYSEKIGGEMTFSCIIDGDIPEYLKEYVYVRSVSADSRKLQQYEVTLTSGDKEIIKNIINDVKIHSIQMHREIIDVTTLPGDPYLYDYIITVIQCLNCNLVFPHVLLRSDSQQTEDGDEFYSDEICPHCGDWDCCDIEFEKFSEKELEILANENKGTTQ